MDEIQLDGDHGGLLETCQLLPGIAAQRQA